jgi:hypothetical protein
MEIVECNPYIEGNEITMNGNYTYGIVASIRDNGTIFANNIDALGINVGDSSSGDSLLPKNSLGVSVKGDALISGNNIESTGIGVNLVEDGTFTINNNNIDVDTEGLVESYAIYSNGISNLVISENAINFFGNTDGTVVNDAILITGDDVKGVAAKNITVKDNIFAIIIPSVDVSYDPDTWASKVMSEGIVFYYCEDVKFIDNSVDLKYNNYSSAYGYDSIYAVSVKSDAYSFGEVQSSDIVISNNTINVDGHACTYAVYVCADNFEISNNEINSTSETYLAHAIDVDGPSAKGIVSENKINVKSPSAVYGIYSYQYMGAIEDIAYVNNTITGESYAACGMEIVECNPYIEGNEITMNGNYTFGIVASIRDNGTIFANNVDALGTNVGDTPTGDGLLPKNSLGVSVKGDALISGNNIESTGIGVNLVEDGTVTINNNNIDVDTAGLVESYAIYADQLSNLVISENAINFFGNTDGTVVNNAIRVNGNDDDKNPAAAKNITVKDNVIAISVPSVDVDYNPDTYAPTVFSEGIVFYFCDGVEFTNNEVDLKYDNARGSYDTIYVVSVKGDAYTYDFDADYNLIYPITASNVVISNNNITGEGHKYIYGVYVSTADNVTIKDNNINMSADDYYAAGINLDGPAFNGVVENNEIAVTAPGAVYGVYTGGWMGAVENTSYENNTITADAYAACAMEIKEANPYISNNKITANGNYTYGIVASISDNATIASNEITCVGSEVGNQSSGDSLLPKNTLAISVKGDALIENNTVDTSGVGVKTLEGEVNVTGNDIKTTGDKAIEAKDTTLTVENNYLASKTGVGQNAVSSNKEVTFVNNSPSLKTIISAPTLYTEYVDGVVFPVALLDENGDPIANKTLLATIDGVVYNQTTDADGLAVFVLDFDAGSYDVVVSFKGDDVYGPKAVNSKIVVDQSPSEIVAPASSTIFLVTVKSGSYYTLTLKDLNGNGLANEIVTITFNGKTANYTTDSLGVIKYKLSATKVGTYKLKMNFAGDNNYVASDATATIKLTKQATKITAKAKTFKAKTKIKKYTITLKDSKGKVIKKAKVTLKIKEKPTKQKPTLKVKLPLKLRN